MKRVLINITILLFVTAFTNAEIKYLFEHLTLEDGLSQSSVQAIIQDKTGFLWFGTADGLNKFDGYKFTVYLNNPFAEGSISDNSITSFYLDQLDNLWIGTASGFLNLYIEAEDKFLSFNISEIDKKSFTYNDDRSDLPLTLSRFSSKTITSIAEDKHGNFWIATWGEGVVLFNPKNLISKRFIHQAAKKSIPSNCITKLAIDRNGNLWGATLDAGIFSISSETIFNINNDTDYFDIILFNKSNKLKDNSIMTIMIDNQNYLWIGSSNKGLFSVNLNNINQLTSTDFVFKQYQNNYLSGNSIMSLVEDQEGYIWIGTFGGGLNRYDRYKDLFIQFTNNPLDKNSIADNDLLSLCVDRSGIIWIGSHLGKGISKLDKGARKFNLIQNEPGNLNSLNNNLVWAIYEDNEEFLWIGTYRGGLNKYNRATGKFTFYKYSQDNPASISYNHVRVIIEDNDGNLWIGTFNGGLNKFNKKTEIFKRYVYDSKNPNSLSANQIQSLYIDKNNFLWIGTFGGGINLLDLNTYDEENPNFKKFLHSDGDNKTPSDNRIYTIFEDSNDNLWFGTFGGGLNLFNRNDNSFRYFVGSINEPKSLSDNRITTIYEDSRGNLWVGTYGGGLNFYNDKDETFTRISGLEGLIISVVYGILEDENGNIWISADNGIIKFNIETKKVLLYNLHDGIQSIEFNGGAYFKNKKGELFFGGISGLNYFHPENIKVNNRIPQIVITDFKIFNHSVPGKHKEIILSYDQNFFSFEFASLDFTNPSNNYFAYMLEGFDKDWVFVDSKHRIANYTNLSPGEYLFRVKGSNNDSVWNEDGVEVYVKILPPFWFRWEFILIASIVFFGSLLYFATIRIRNYLVIERLKSKLAADLHDNIGSGLTEISILSELIATEVGKNNSNTTEKLNHISNISRMLIDNMSDIVWMVNPRRDSLHDLMIRLKDSYADLFTQMGISFKTRNLEELQNVKLTMECKQNLYLIFKEGIHNCIKHSGCMKIYIEAQVRKNILSMRLIDDGNGFTESNIVFGNGIKNMKKRAESINGKLKIKSEISTGTVITFVGDINPQRISNAYSDLIEFKEYIFRR